MLVGEARWTLAKRAAQLSLGIAISLALAKLGASILTGSVALLSSAVDSIADIAASAMTFLSVRIAAQPPDHFHRYGHGKAESLSALAQALVVAGSGVFVLIEAVRRFIRPEPLQNSGLGLGVMIVSIVVTLLLVMYQRRVIRLTGSPAIAADRLHYESDLLTNMAVIVSLVASRFYDLDQIDALIGGAIAAYLLVTALRIGRDAVQVLMDRELPPDDRAEIETIINGHPEVRGCHDLRTREAGGIRFIECHLELDPAMSVQAAHDVTDAIEAELVDRFPEAEILIHQEPAGICDARLDDKIEQNNA